MILQPPTTSPSVDIPSLPTLIGWGFVIAVLLLLGRPILGSIWNKFRRKKPLNDPSIEEPWK